MQNQLRNHHVPISLWEGQPSAGQSSIREERKTFALRKPLSISAHQPLRDPGRVSGNTVMGVACIVMKTQNDTPSYVTSRYCVEGWLYPPSLLHL